MLTQSVLKALKSIIWSTPILWALAVEKKWRPFLFVELCIAAYTRFRGNKGKYKQKCWIEPTNAFQLFPAIGNPFLLQADAAIRNSMTAASNCSSSFSFGTILALNTWPLKATMSNAQCSKCTLKWVFAILSLPSYPDLFITYISLPTPVFLLPPILALQVNLVKPGQFILATLLLTRHWEKEGFNSIKEGGSRFERPVKGSRAKLWGVFIGNNK